MPRGRKTEFSQIVADAICERLADGESLRAICQDDSTPAKATVFKWLGQNPQFADQYARARESQADALVDEILEIADDASNDWMARNVKEGQAPGYDLNGEHVQRSRLRVDSRKWFASKVAPKKYGEKLQAELSGPDGAPLVPILNVTVEAPKA